MKPTFAIIVAVDANFGIGKNGTLPWQLPADLKHFKAITSAALPNKSNAVIMGRKTWESLPPKFRPLPGRVNLVLSHQPDLKLLPEVLRAGSLEEGLKQLTEKPLSDSVDKIFVIGGGQIFRQAVAHPSCSKLYLTHILKSFDCDCFFPQESLSSYKQIQKSKPAMENSLEFFFAEYVCA